MSTATLERKDYTTAELEQMLKERKKQEEVKAEKEKQAYEQGRDEMIQIELCKHCFSCIRFI